MKKKNCRCDYTDDRNRRLRKEFEARLGGRAKTLDSIFNTLSNIEAPRFYISEERAYSLVRQKLNNGAWHSHILPSRKEMIQEIFSRVMNKVQSENISLKDAVYQVVNSPAPTFYLNARSIRTILYTA